MLACYFKEDNTALVIYLYFISFWEEITRLRFYHKLLSERDMVSFPEVYFAEY